VARVAQPGIGNNREVRVSSTFRVSVRSMKKQLMFVMCAVAVASVGCKKKPADGGSGSATGSATPTPAGSGSAAIAGTGSTTQTAATAAGSAAASGPGCASPTAYKSPAGAFCIEAPPGYTAKETKSSDYNAMVAFQKDASSFVVSISLQDASHASYDGMSIGMDGRSKDPATVIAKGDLTDVTGKFLVENVGKHVAESLQVIVKGKTHSYACGGENYMPTVDPVILAAC
jgi:hypothetical protein